MAELRLPAWPARVTHAEAPACLAAIESALASAAVDTEVVLDASGLRVFDSSAVAVLLAVARLVQARGLRWSLPGLPPRLRELATLYGVGELLPG